MSSEPRFRTPLSRLPIRLRLAVSVAAVVFVILGVFAVAVARTNRHRLLKDFYAQVDANARRLEGHFGLRLVGNQIVTPYPSQLVGNVGTVVNVLTEDGGTVLAHTPTGRVTNLGNPVNQDATGAQGMVETNYNGYRVVDIPITIEPGGNGWLQYAQPLSSINGEIGGLQLILLIGVLAGTALAFGAGALVARRAIAPIAELTAAAGEIERTRDPSRTLPTPTADDEVAELSRTLSSMLVSLSDARNETEATLERQRAFVADASHELRTPLTSVLANLELLSESLQGVDRETAHSALRSTQRMRRLVGDLLLLARADTGREPARESLDLGEIATEAAGELEPSARDHVLELDVSPTPVVGSRDDLQRVATNLIENALRHTPPGTHVNVSTRPLADGSAELIVADDGPGIPPELRPKLFARFVRGTGDRGGSFGLGLAIVSAVTQAHGGTVEADESHHAGARFTVRLPAHAAPALAEPNPATPAEPIIST
jgi:two-component system OmpR family sensor kinase